jgi:hypothetical protein
MRRCAVDEVLPQITSRGDGQGGIFDREVDARFEGCVKSADSVCCEEHYALVVLERSEEDLIYVSSRRLKFVITELTGYKAITL